MSPRKGVVPAQLRGHQFTKGSTKAKVHGSKGGRAPVKTTVQRGRRSK
jgi:hypothetical protein